MAKASKKPAAKSAAKPSAKAKPVKKAASAKKVAAPAKVSEAKSSASTKEPKKKAPPAPPAPPAKKASAPSVAAPAPAAAKKAEKPAKPKPPADRAGSEDYQKWSDLYDKHASAPAPAYNMSASYEANTPLQHKVLGWGFILSNQNDRLEVLFESGPKMLISNYKAT